MPFLHPHVKSASFAPRIRRLAVGLAAVVPVLSPVGHLQPRPDTTVTTVATNTTVTGSTWAGYAVTGKTYTSVTTTYAQPAVKCTSGDQYSSFWAGLDGYSSDSVEQAGTNADCVGGTADYSAWYELYPAAPVTYSNTVKPGDVITLTIAFSGTDTYTLTTKNTTEGWTKTTKKISAGDARSSAEIIAEAPYSGGVTPIANFSKVTFTGCEVDGATLGSFDPTAITSPGLTVSPITNGTVFSVTQTKTTG